jgi:hypothetical protein
MKLFVFIDQNTPAHSEFRHNSNDSNILVKILQQNRKEETLQQRKIFFCKLFNFSTYPSSQANVILFFEKKKKEWHTDRTTPPLYFEERETESERRF